MRDLTCEEIEAVAGGELTLKEGAAFITSLSMYSPVTMAFGIPIAASLILVDYLTSE